MSKRLALCRAIKRGRVAGDLRFDAPRGIPGREGHFRDTRDCGDGLTLAGPRFALTEHAVGDDVVHLDLFSARPNILVIQLRGAKRLLRSRSAGAVPVPPIALASS